MGEGRTEACGRCAMSSVVEAVEEGREESERRRDPFGGARIEVADADLRKASPGAWLGGLKRRIDELATRLTYGR